MSDEQVIRTNVLLEELNSKMTTLVEGHGVLGDRMGRLELRFDGLEHKVDGLEHKVDGLEHKVDGLEHKVDGIAADVAESKQRLTRIEHHLGLNGGPKKTRRRTR